MAGAGYKLFNTGDVLTAQQVNEYLMQQTTMVFASAAARTSALSGVLAEGMVSYLQDTNTLEVYDGSAWVGATGDITGLTAGTGISISSATGPVPTITNSVATTFDALGDLIVGTGADTFAKLSVGESGSTLVADSSQSTGLRWGSNYGFTAGKNFLINGDFRINQRNFTSLTANGYGHDRWRLEYSGSSVTYSTQTFTPGSAPVAGYEGVNFARVVTSGQSAVNDYALIEQRIEDVRTTAGKTVTVSFWAKAASGTPKVGVASLQVFGGGGSPDVVTAAGDITISTSWARYSVTYNIPSISGKTVGTASSLRLLFWTSCGSTYGNFSAIGLQNATIDFWGMQAETGSVATAFQTATGTLAGELAACQRYYFDSRENGTTNQPFSGYTNSTDYLLANVRYPVTMRTTPSITIGQSSGTNFVRRISTNGQLAITVTSYPGTAPTGFSAVYAAAAPFAAAVGYDFYILASAEL